MKKEGFTLIELLAVIIILIVLSALAIPSIFSMIRSSKDKSYEILISSFEENTRLYASRYRDEVEDNLDLYDSFIVTLNDLKKDNLLKTPIKDPRTDENIGLDKQIIITRDIDNSLVFCFEDRGCNVPDNSYSLFKGVNKPELINGMTPIKWNGSAWITTTPEDDNWYNYTSADKKWANAMTADGSFWVWIPRFAYQISSGYHNNVTGSIKIKFLVNKTNKTDDSSSVATTPTYNDSIQTNYIVHPAFTFGDEELKGIWVAKFEASGTTANVSIKPNVPSLRNISVSDMYQAARNMENNNAYGWGTSGIGIDTHMMKNTEWGAVAYLSQSNYGKNAEIWINPNNAYLTGCAGDTVSAGLTSGCNQYHTANGIKASTTGNVYGIYDMAGGAWEYVASYVNNGTGNLTLNGNNIITANEKYKDSYIVTVDGSLNNYNNTINKKGDAIYETSNSHTVAASWYNDYSYMPFSIGPWFLRGGGNDGVDNTGIFAFSKGEGASNIIASFRVVLLVGEGY